MTTITGTLEGADYGDNVDRDLTAGTYTYTLTNNGPGHLSFKVEEYLIPDTGEEGLARWKTIEEKAKLAEGVNLGGTLKVGSQEQSHDPARVRFNFNREFLSKKTSYKLVFSPR